MNIAFFGSDEFAVPALKALAAAGHKLVSVVTQPDKRKGRGLHLAFTNIKATANSLGLKVYQPDNVNSKESISFLNKINAELFVVIAYGQILSEEVLKIPKNFSINVHASLLPKYRGAAPINYAIINGEKETGVTIIKLTKEMDSGPIILQEKTTIEEYDNAMTLRGKLSEIGQKLLLEAIERIENNTYEERNQEHSRATFSPKLRKADGLIKWERSASEILNLIKGCYDWPVAYTRYRGKILKIYKAVVFLPIEDSKVIPFPGEISRIMSDGIVVCTGKGDLIIEELQIEGKRRMLASEFIAGHKMRIGETLGNFSCN